MKSRNLSIVTKTTFVTLVLSALVLAGCRSTVPSYEKKARDAVNAVGKTRSEMAAPANLPALTASATPEDYLSYALLKHPRVQAAYYDWRAAVEDITPARSQPNPQITFQADITNMLTSLMPGLMFDFMGRGKREAMGREAAATSDAAYLAYETTTLSVITATRKAWNEIVFVDETLALREQTASLLKQSETMAQADYATGKGMSTLERLSLLLNEKAKLDAEIATLKDRRAAARQRFKSVLGLRHDDPDPAWPAKPFPTQPLPDEDTLWRHLAEHNPQIASMRAMVDMAVAKVTIANREKRPDFTAGLMADVKMDPVLYRPTATMTLPIWRDKIEAQIASAEARKLAAESRLNAEQIAMSAELSQMLFMAREAGRMIDYIDTGALPNIRRIIESSDSAYRTGMGDFNSLVTMRLMELGMEIEKTAARLQRDDAMADIAALAADGRPPAMLGISTDSPITNNN